MSSVDLWNAVAIAGMAGKYILAVNGLQDNIESQNEIDGHDRPEDAGKRHDCYNPQTFALRER